MAEAKKKKPGRPKGATRKMPVVPEYRVKEALNDEFLPVRYQQKLRRALTGNSRVDSMDMFCIMCMGYSYEDVKHCPSVTCPLWRWRPGGND